jgi:hypothetical protein
VSKLRLDHSHGANKNHPGAAKKKGGNKGIALERRLRKRAEAEARNAKTPPERRKRYRKEMLSDAA